MGQIVLGKRVHEILTVKRPRQKKALFPRIPLLIPRLLPGYSHSNNREVRFNLVSYPTISNTAAIGPPKKLTRKHGCSVGLAEYMPGVVKPLTFDKRYL